MYVYYAGTKSNFDLEISGLIKHKHSLNGRAFMSGTECRQIRQLLQDGVIRGGHSPVAGSSDFRLCAQQKHKPCSLGTSHNLSWRRGWRRNCFLSQIISRPPLIAPMFFRYPTPFNHVKRFKCPPFLYVIPKL